MECMRGHSDRQIDSFLSRGIKKTKKPNVKKLLNPKQICANILICIFSSVAI